jgi:MYXO-CTERM domain-containing protein
MTSLSARLATLGASAALLLLATERPAAAYSYQSAVSVGCHERITMATLRIIRGQLATAPAIDPDRNDLALVNDLPFDLDPDMKDLAAATLIVGVRDNDLKGRGPNEVDALAQIHGDPNRQQEHCLRATDDDEPDGSTRALAACKDFIRQKLVESLDGLDAAGIPDPNKRTDLDVSLSLRGKVTASLPLFWVRIGQALHTVQDGFAHTFRSPDRQHIRTILNYIEYVNGDEVESRDGPLHRTGLDACDDLDDLRTLNIGVATQASIDLLHATLDPALGRDAKLAAIDATLAKYFVLDPGCTDANGWCDAPERQYEVAQSCGCSVVGAKRNGALAAGGLLLGLAFLAARRRRRLAVLPIALACLVTPSLASAQSNPEPESTTPAPVTTDPSTGEKVGTDEKKPPPGVPTVQEAKAERTEEEHRRLFGLYGAVSGSVTNPGLSGQLGVRFRLSERWTVGLDGELNGWYGVQNKSFRTGAFNGYVTGIFHYPIRFAQVNLRSTAQLGTSTMLIDLYGAPRGTTGIFVGLVPLGLEIKLSSAFYLVFDALGVGLPVPQLKGAPFAYPQYRTALGLEVTF